MSRDPHYLRVARALALITGLAGVATGCSDDRPSGTDSGMVADGSVRLDGSGGGDSGGGGDGSTGTDGGGGTDGSEPTDGSSSQDSGATDGATLVDAAGFDCSTCTCWVMDGSTLPMCPDNIDIQIACGCIAIGPLAPPDLPV